MRIKLTIILILTVLLLLIPFFVQNRQINIPEVFNFAYYSDIDNKKLLISFPIIEQIRRGNFMLGKLKSYFIIDARIVSEFQTGDIILNGDILDFDSNENMKCKIYYCLLEIPDNLIQEHNVIEINKVFTSKIDSKPFVGITISNQ